MELFKKHVDTVIILGGILGSIIWMNGKFNSLDKDIAIIKTVLILNKMLPESLATDGKPK